jgi:tetratricopeptide (TPR) repeat protein
MCMIPRARLLPVTVLVLVLLVTAIGVSAAETFQVELIHPQSDDQGRYVGASQATHATIFGVVSPAEAVKSITVNDRPAQTFAAELLPFGAAAGADSLEFRATVELGPATRLTVLVHGAEGPPTRAVLDPDGPAVVARLRERVKADAKSSRDRCRLGGALRDSGKLEEAVDELRASLSANMSCVSTRVTLGKALLSVGRPEEAVKEFRLATETMPDYAMAWLNLGLVHARFTRNTQEAVRCFRRYLELEPNSSIADKVRRYVGAQG